MLRRSGVNIIIALGHSGYETDKNIGINCPLVDAVIGGHSHSFLYTGVYPGMCLLQQCHQFPCII